MPYSSLFIFELYFFHGFMLICFCFTYLLHSPPRFFTLSFTHRTCLPYFHLTLPRAFLLPPSHIAPLRFPPTTTHEYPVFLFYLYLCSPSFVLPTLQPHSPLIQSQYLQHNSVLSLQRHTTPPHLFPPSPLPHQPLTQQPHFTSTASQYP